MTHLELSYNQIEELDVLKNMRLLQKLNIGGNNLNGDLSLLANLVELQDLDLHYYSIE